MERFPGAITLFFSTTADYTDRTPLERRQDGYLGCLQLGNVHLYVDIAAGVSLFPSAASLPALFRHSRFARSRRCKSMINVIAADAVMTTSQHRALQLVECAEEPPGFFLVWEVDVISQRGAFFCTVQRTHRVRCYRSGTGELVCPEIQGHKSLFARLRDLYREKISTLEPLENYQIAPPPSRSNLRRNQGWVRWYNYSRGHGVIVTNRGDAWVYWDKIRCDRPFIHLNEGEQVRFEEILSINNTRTSIRFRVNGVEPIAPQHSNP